MEGEKEIKAYQKFASGKTVIKYSDMNPELQQETSEIVASAIEKNQDAHGLKLEQACKNAKETLDKKFGPAWHCIIGEGYSFEITGQAGNVLYMYYGGTLGIYAVLIYKC